MNQHGSEEIDFGRMRAVLRRHARLVIAVGLGLSALITGVILALPNWYSAEAVLVVDPRPQVQLGGGLGGQDAAAMQAVDPGLVRSEMELLTDAGVAIDVIKQLDLLDDPDFARLAAPPVPHLWSPSFWAARLRALMFGGVEATTDDEAAPVLRLSKAMLKHLFIINDPRSYVLHLQFEWTAPEIAQKIANTWVEAFLARQLAAKYANENQAGDWLKARTTELQTRAQDAERLVQEFRDTHQLLDVKGSTVLLQQLGELNTQLVLASSDLAQKEGILAQVQAQGRAGVTDTATSVLASPLIQRLREQEADASRRLAELTTTYGEQHPLVRQARNQIADLDTKIKIEIAKVAASAAADVASSRARVDDLHRQIDMLKSDAVAADADQVRLRKLERDAQAERALLQQFLLQSKEMDTREGIERPPARLVTAASLPEAPSFPNRAVLIALGIVGSFSLGALGAFGRERLTRRFIDPAGVERAANAPLLGTVPEIRVARGIAVADYVVRWPHSEFGEAIRTIRTRVYAALTPPIAGAVPAGRVVLVTSAVPEEGKTTIAASIARSAAMSGTRVLLIDADLRRPSVRRALQSEGHEAVRTPPRFEGIVSGDGPSGLHYLAAADNAVDSAEALGTHALGEMIAEARRGYDLVVVDSPPVLVVSDAAVLSSFADAVIYVLRWQRTPRAEVLGAIKFLRHAGAKLAGIVLSRVDTNRLLHEWVADTGLVHGRYRGYYDTPKTAPPATTSIAADPSAHRAR